MKKTRAEKALPKNGPTKRVGSGTMVRVPVACEKRFYAHYDHAGEMSTITLRQNLETDDQWHIELFLERGRSAAELAEYLRWAAETVEAAQARHPNAKDEPRRP